MAVILLFVNRKGIEPQVVNHNYGKEANQSLQPDVIYLTYVGRPDFSLLSADTDK